MNTVHILDCTLRDGGYCNQWDFGFDNVKMITSGLVDADIEIIECGFLTNKVNYNINSTRFTSVEKIAEIIPENRNGKMFVAMMNYGEYNIDVLPAYDGSSIDGIRVAFHKKNMLDALEICKKIKAKGYKVFIQPMVSLNYTDDEFFYLIKRTNEIEPYAFYIVDSFGNMKIKSLTKLFYVIEHNLSENIWIGFHSHNNMQLAFSNAQALVGIQTNRNLIIDSSIYGMGRGAGNLNTELFVEYLNETHSGKYKITPLLKIIDEILNNFYQKNYWGYSLPNYISAVHNAHPNYASYLDDKKTLTVENINEIFNMINSEKSVEFDKAYIEELYLEYMNRNIVHEERLSLFKKQLQDKKVLLIAPGKSSIEEIDKFINLLSSDILTISINHEHKYIDTDFIFISNLRRFASFNSEKKSKTIVTSNISADKVYLIVSYKEILNNTEMVKDNAGLMCIKMLMNMGVKEILLVGFDGYSYNSADNYSLNEMEYITKKAVFDAMNNGMSKVISDFSREISIKFITSEKHIHIIKPD